MAKPRLKKRLTWGERLRAWRLGRKLLQVDAAKLLGVSQPTLSYWELDKKTPRYAEDLARVRRITRIGAP